MKSSRTINESVNELLMKGWREGVVRGWIGNEQPTNKWWKMECAGWGEMLFMSICSFMWFYVLSCAGNAFIYVLVMCEWWNLVVKILGKCARGIVQWCDYRYVIRYFTLNLHSAPVWFPCVLLVLFHFDTGYFQRLFWNLCIVFVDFS